jgi:hypothetical protein
MKCAPGGESARPGVRTVECPHNEFRACSSCDEHGAAVEKMREKFFRFVVRGFSSRREIINGPELHEDIHD